MSVRTGEGNTSDSFWLHQASSWHFFGNAWRGVGYTYNMEGIVLLCQYFQAVIVDLNHDKKADMRINNKF
jgi:hypothetical protein